MSSNQHFLSSHSTLGLVFGHFFFYLRFPSLSVVMTRFGKSCDLKTKTLKTQAAYIFLKLHKGKRVTCIKMQKPMNLSYWKSYDVAKTLWRHYFLGNANLNKSICQFLHLSALHLLSFLPWEKMVQAAWVLWVFVFKLGRVTCFRECIANIN